MSGGSQAHNLIASNLLRRLGNALEGRACRVYTSDMRVYLSPTLTIHRGDEEHMS